MKQGWWEQNNNEPGDLINLFVQIDKKTAWK